MLNPKTRSSIKTPTFETELKENRINKNRIAQEYETMRNIIFPKKLNPCLVSANGSLGVLGKVQTKHLAFYAQSGSPQVQSRNVKVHSPNFSN